MLSHKAAARADIAGILIGKATDDLIKTSLSDLDHQDRARLTIVKYSETLEGMVADCKDFGMQPLEVVRVFLTAHKAMVMVCEEALKSTLEAQKEGLV